MQEYQGKVSFALNEDGKLMFQTYYWDWAPVTKYSVSSLRSDIERSGCAAPDWVLEGLDKAEKS